MCVPYLICCVYFENGEYVLRRVWGCLGEALGRSGAYVEKMFESCWEVVAGKSLKTNVLENK